MEFIETESGLAVDFTLGLPHGLHARPSAKLAQAAQCYQARILLISENGEADAKSMVEVMALAPQANSRLRLMANGPDAREALAGLCGQLTSGRE